MPDSVSHNEDDTPNQVYGNISDDRIIAALKSALKTRKVSMRALSESLSIPYRSLQNYFSGESRMPADVLLRICAEIGLEADYLLKSGFEVVHGDLYDAVHKVFKDVLPWIEIRGGSQLGIRKEPLQDKPEAGVRDRSELLTVAYILTVRLNEAYAHYRESSFKGNSSKPLTSSEHQLRADRQARKRKVGQ